MSDNSSAQSTIDDEIDITQLEKTENNPEFEDFQDEDFNFDFGPWGNYGIDCTLWRDEYKPIEKLLYYEDLILTEEERSGFLTDRVIASCSSYLERNPITRKYCLCKCVLVNKGLNDISIIEQHPFLQYLDLSFNNLTDLSALNCLPFLMYLDVSYNKLKELLNFNAPYNLTYTNWSNNQIEKINDLSAFWTLKELNLSQNKIEKIEGLEKLRYLTKLDLSHNCIKCIEKLNNLQITTLKLQHNKINSFEWGEGLGLQTMLQLSSIYLSHNQLRSLLLFENAISLQSIEMESNCIEDVLEISHLKSLPYLVNLDLIDNPITLKSNYDSVCLQTIPTLKYKDKRPINDKEMIRAQVENNSNIKMHSGRLSTKLSALKYFNEHNLGISVIPADQPPVPLILLVGIEGSRCCQLAKKYANFYPEYSSKIEKHTTRPPLPNEAEDDYKFVSKKDFHDLLLNGEFLTLSMILDECYGITHSAFYEACADQKKVLIVDAYLEEALTMKSRGLRPLLVLCMPKCRNKHMRLLMESYQSVIFNSRYPEGAVKIIPRENAYIDDETIVGFGSDNDEDMPKDYILQIDNALHTSSVSNENETVRKFIINSQLLYPCESLSSSTSTVTGSSNENTKLVIENEENIESNTPYTRTFNSPRTSSNTLTEPCSEETFKSPPKGSRISSSWIDELSSDYYNYILKLREQYLTLHQENPGLFYDVIYTDDLNLSIEKLNDVVQRILETHSHGTPLYNPYNDAAFEHIAIKKLKKYEDDMTRFMKRYFECLDVK